ncbi:MAG: cation-translocating P-type ATPase, partial [Castellaniella sp.]
MHQGHANPHRHAHAHPHEGSHAQEDAACCASAAADAAPVSALDPPRQEDGAWRTQLRIRQMDCPTEAALIRQALEPRADVQALEFNLIARVLTLRHAPGALDDILAAIRALGFTPEQSDDPMPPETPKRWWPLIASGVAALAAEAAHWLAAPWWVPAVLAVLAVAGSGLGTYRKGWTALRHGQLNINALMSIAVTGALVLGQWAEAAMVMVLYELAERIEALSLDRARRAVQGLMQLSPDHAAVLQADGQWLEIAAAKVLLGDLVRVRPGERIALDGDIVAGQSAIDQSPITGESLPVDKAPGDPVYAGTINGSGTLEYRVTSLAAESTLARIIRAIESAQSARAPTQRFVDRFARVYTPLVVLFALGVAVLPPLLGLGGWYDWVYKALVLLVIACPCALVISTPVTIVSGLATAARHGVLVKGGSYLELGRQIRWLALDKTGTITRGQPALASVAILGDSAADPHRFALAIADASDHPVSRAVAAGLRNQPDQPRDGIPLAVTGFQALPGRGSRADIGGQAYWLGNHRLIHERGLCSPALEARLAHLEQQGQTVVLLASDTQVLSLYAVADHIKPDSQAAIRQLHALGVRTLILSGDNPHTVAAIARQAGITEARGDQLPEDKLQAVDRLSASGAVVGMAGDGINDAPALARADIGFAMGSMGTDAA